MRNVPSFAPAGALDQPALLIDEAARTMRVSRATVYRLIDRGQLKRVKVGSRALVEGESIRQLLGAAA